MSRFPKKRWQEFSPATLNVAKSIAKMAVPSVEGALISRGPYETKRAAQIYRGEWFRFRETLRTDTKRLSDPVCYEGRLYAILENLTSSVEQGTAPLIGEYVQQWWVNFTFHPHVIDHWREEPAMCDAARNRHALFLALEGVPTNDPAIIAQRDRLLAKTYTSDALGSPPYQNDKHESQQQSSKEALTDDTPTHIFRLPTIKSLGDDNA